MADRPALVCVAESAKLPVTLLTCLANGRRDQRVWCDVDAHGLMFTVHSKGKSLQIKTNWAREFFDSYEFDGTALVNVAEKDDDDYDDDEKHDHVSFALSLNTLIECLSILGSNALAVTSLRLTYVPRAARLVFVVEGDNGILGEGSMNVLEREANDVGSLEFESAFENSVVVGRCIMQSEPLREAFAELYDLPSAAAVTITMMNEQTARHGNEDEAAKCLQLSATSETGTCDIAFARTSSSFIEFSCASDSGQCAGTFHVAVLQQAFKALAHSNETFLRMNQQGFLSVQHMIEAGDGNKAFVDVLVSPEETSIP